ncbi:MAG: flagellar hook-basal body complex protein FliE [Peptostreptococcales bacterium]
MGDIKVGGLYSESKNLMLGRVHEKGDHGLSFKNVFQEELREVNRLQIESDEMTKQLILGETDNIHDVMIKTTEATLALEMTVQVRNKIVEAYQEIMRMQI